MKSKPAAASAASASPAAAGGVQGVFSRGENGSSKRGSQARGAATRFAPAGAAACTREKPVSAEMPNRRDRNRAVGANGYLDRMPRGPSRAGEALRDSILEPPEGIGNGKDTDRADVPGLSRLLRQEETHRVGEPSLRLIVDAAPVMLVCCGRDLRYRFVNRACAEFLGLTPEQIVGRPIRDVLGAKAFAAIRPQIGSVLQGRPVAYEMEVPYKRAGKRFMQVTYHPERNGEGRVIGWVAAIQDMTEARRAAGALRRTHDELELRVRERTEELLRANEALLAEIANRKLVEKALRESQTRLQAIMDHSPAMIFLKDRRGRYLHFNRRFAQEFNLSLIETVGKTDREVLGRERAAAFRANDAMVIRSGEPVMFDEIAVQDNGSTRISMVTKFPLRRLDGAVYAVGAIVTDVTERKRLEAEVLHISEREQRRIAQDLHDGLGQHLSGISILSNVLRQNLVDQASSEARTAARISELLDSAVAQTRSLARGLFPVEPEPAGLMSALESLASHIGEVFRVSCQFECRQPVFVHCNATATHLFRIVQEAISNSIKHGRASAIKIGLSSSLGRIRVTVSDNGVGFKPHSTRRPGLGLRIMNYRAGVLGGTLLVKNNGAGGVDVACSVKSSRTLKVRIAHV